MPPPNYDVIFYPTVGKGASKKFKDVGDVMVEFRAALSKYLVTVEKLCEPDDVRDIVMEVVKAKALMLDAKVHADAAAKEKVPTNLVVSGGIDKSGHLVVSVTDTLPNNFAKFAIVRKDFVQTVIKLFRKQKNVVANIDSNPNDELIKRNADLQAKKFNTTVQKGDDEVDVGGIKIGTIVLAAHGDELITEGTVIGKNFAGKTPAQIVALLTENSDERKRLSPKFKGTIILSGCFTAAGNDIVPDGYDYSVFAKKVKELLDAKGHSNYLLKGMAGPSKTKKSGDKKVIPVADHVAVEKAKEKLQAKSVEVLQVNQKVQALELRLKMVESELLTSFSMFKQVTELFQKAPDSEELESLKDKIQSQMEALFSKETELNQEIKEAQALQDEKIAKLEKRAEKVNQTIAALKHKYSTEGVITYGLRRL